MAGNGSNVETLNASAQDGERTQPWRPQPIGGLALGLPNYWYPILRSSELRDTPVRLKRFGEDIVVWRDSSGGPHINQDRCPHRGASLALGKIKGDTLACGYHGWTFDGTGACIHISATEGLADNGKSLMSRACLKTYPAEDRAGYIWAFYGDAAKRTPLSVPYELEDPRWCVITQEYVWGTNWINILDNILDPLHALFVHVGVFTQRRRAKLSQFKVVADFEEGFHLAKRGIGASGAIGDVEPPVEFLLPSVFRLDLSDGSPRGMMRVVMLPTPIEADSTYLCYLQARRVSGLARLWFRLLWAVKLRSAQDVIKEQDRQILASLGPISESRLHENLGPSDVGVVHLRRRLSRAYAQSQTPHSGEQPSTRLSPRARGPFAAWERELDR